MNDTTIQERNESPLVLVTLQRPKLTCHWVTEQRVPILDEIAGQQQNGPSQQSSIKRAYDNDGLGSNTESEDEEDIEPLGSCIPPPSGDFWPDASRGEVETRCRLVQYRNRYIPFNPYVGDEANKHRRFKKGVEYFMFPTVSPNLMHEFPDGTSIQLYRWMYRHWIFKKFDEGIKLDAGGFMDVTPESVAKYIAKRIRRLTPYRKRGLIVDRHVMENSDYESIKICDKEVNGQVTEGEIHVSSTVVDGCCGYGGNAIQLARQFDRVIGIDINKDRLKMAQHNGELYKVGSRIQWIHSDFNEWCNRKRLLEVKLLDDGITTSSTRSFRTDVETPKHQEDRGDTDYYKSSEVVPFCPLSSQQQTNDDSRKESERYQSLYPWVFLSPPWGGESYKDEMEFQMRNVPECNVYDLVITASSIGRNICVYLPPNQNINEVIELGSELPRCCSIIMESIAVGLRKKTKYIIVEFLDEETSHIAFPNFHIRAAQFLVDELEEQQSMIHSFVFLFKKIGVREMFVCLEEALEIANKGGLMKTDAPGERRTRGGIFFQVIKQKHSRAYKDLNKIRKTYIAEKFKNQPKKKSGSDRAKKKPISQETPHSSTTTLCFNG